MYPNCSGLGNIVHNLVLQCLQVKKYNYVHITFSTLGIVNFKSYIITNSSSHWFRQFIVRNKIRIIHLMKMVIMEFDRMVFMATVQISTKSVDCGNITLFVSGLDFPVYTSQLQEVSALLPASIMMDEDVCPSSPLSDSMSPGQDVSDVSPGHSMLSPHFNSVNTYQDSPNCNSQLENTSDVEVDVWQALPIDH